MEDLRTIVSAQYFVQMSSISAYREEAYNEMAAAREHAQAEIQQIATAALNEYPDIASAMTAVRAFKHTAMAALINRLVFERPELVYCRFMPLQATSDTFDTLIDPNRRLFRAP